jgi:hypothetical protein
MTDDSSIHSHGERNLGTLVPIPISDTVDVLVERAMDVGERTTRKELVGALIFALATTEGDQLRGLIHDFRLATMGQLPDS